MPRLACCLALGLFCILTFSAIHAGEPDGQIAKDGEDAYKADNFHKAIDLFEKALAASPGDLRSRRGRGVAFNAIAEYSKALLDFEAVLKVSPDDAIAHFGRGRALRRRGRSCESMASLTKAVQLDPTGEGGFLARCERALLFADLGDLPQAQHDVDAAITAQPKRAEGYFARGYVHVARGTEKEFELGLLDFDHAYKLRPHYMDALIEEAKLLARYDGAFLDASLRLNRALKVHSEDRKDPLLGVLHAARAWVILMGFIPPAAADDLKIALELAPDEPFVHYVEGEYFLKMREPNRAVASFSRCIELGGPLRTFSHVLRGDAYADSGQCAEAAADYTQALAFYLPDKARASAYYNRGIVFEDLHDYQKALADYSSAIGLSPKKVECYNNRGNVYDLLGDHDKAMADYREAIRLDPNDITAYVNRAARYYQKQQFDLALSDYNKAISLVPSEACLYERRAAIYDAKGLKGQAKADRDKAKALAAAGTTPPRSWKAVRYMEESRKGNGEHGGQDRGIPKAQTQ